MSTLLTCMSRLAALAALFLSVAAIVPYPLLAQTIATTSTPVSNPVYVNIYWDADWDLHNPTMTMNRIDNFTSALIGSSYFFGLAEYGVSQQNLFLNAGAQFFAKSFKADPSCGSGGTAPATLPLSGGIFGPDVLGFVECEANLVGMPNGGNVIYNIFFPPFTREVDALGVFPSCPPQYVSYHFHGRILSGTPIFTAIFSNPSCASDFKALTVNLSHEMIEAATDPFPPLDVIFSGGSEIADFGCVGTTPFLSAFGGGASSLYWSNSLQACRSGFFNRLVPDIKTITTIGVGSLMTIDVQGTGFGQLQGSILFSAVPAYAGNASTTITLPATANLPYFSLTDLNSGVEAGNTLDSTPTKLLYTLWGDTEIKVNGFGSGLIPHPGDTLTVTVCNPGSGACATRAFALPTAPIITAINPSFGPAGGGTQVTITGSGFVNPIEVRFHGKLAPVNSISATTLSVTTPPVYPGPAEVAVASSGIYDTYSPVFDFCAPSVVQVQPSSGPAAGGTPVKISGTCFTGATGASFGPSVQLLANAQLTVVSDNEIDTHSPPLKAIPPYDCRIDVTVRSPFESGAVNGPSGEFKYEAEKCPPEKMRPPRNMCQPFARCHGLAKINIFKGIPRGPQVAFKDLGSYGWASAAIKSVVDKNIVDPVANDLFAPDSIVTRRQFAVALARTLLLPDIDVGITFTDVSPEQADYYLFGRVQPYLIPISNRYGVLTFGAELPIERQEAASAIVTLLVVSNKVKQSQIEEEADGTATIRDRKLITPPFRSFVSASIRERILVLDRDGNFRPDAFLTRADLAVLLDRLIRLFSR